MKRFLSFLALVGAVAVAYGNSLWGSFQFDDFNVIVHNPVVHSWPAWLADLPSGIRPILKFTYTLNWISELGGFGFHLLNLLIHTGNTLLIYRLSLRFFNEDQEDLRRAVALTAALLFALHPVQTEAVTYICGRSASLMAFFYLASLLAYIHGCAQRQRGWLYFFSPLLFAMALLTKETAATLPAALLLWDRTREPERSWKLTLQRQSVHWGLLVLMVIGVLVHRGYLRLFAFSFNIRGLQENLLSQANGICYLLADLFWPRALNIDPDLPIVSQWNGWVAAEALLLGAMIFAGFFFLRRRPPVGFGLLWFFLHLLPTNSVVPRTDIANDRQLYLACFGIFLAFAWEARKAAKVAGGGRVLFRTGVVITALGLCFLTIGRNHVYRSEIALWEDTVKKSPNRARVHNNLGYAYYLAGRHEEARGAYLIALYLKPDFVLAGNNLAVVENILGQKTQGNQK